MVIQTPCLVRPEQFFVKGLSCTVAKQQEVLDCVDELCHHLYDFKRRKKETYGLPRFSHCFSLVREAIGLLSDEQARRVINRWPSFVARIEFVRTRLIAWTDEFEKEASNRYAIGSWDHPYLSDVYKQVDDEVCTACVERSSRVLFIGAGHFPESAIRIAANKGCHVTCAEISKDACETSRRLIAKTSLPINIQWRDGADLNCADFSHIWIAALVPEKERILRKISLSVRSEAFVIVRYGNDLKELFNQPLSLEESCRYDILASTTGQLCDCVYLRRR